MIQSIGDRASCECGRTLIYTSTGWKHGGLGATNCVPNPVAMPIADKAKLSQPVFGDRAVCQMCSEWIEFVGPHWQHADLPPGIQPRHPAWPREPVAMLINEPNTPIPVTDTDLLNWLGAQRPSQLLPILLEFTERKGTLREILVRRMNDS